MGTVIRIKLDQRAAEAREQFAIFVTRYAFAGDLGISYWAMTVDHRPNGIRIHERNEGKVFGLTLKKARKAWDLMATEYGVRWSTNPRFVDATRYDEAIQLVMFGERKYA